MPVGSHDVYVSVSPEFHSLLQSKRATCFKCDVARAQLLLPTPNVKKKKNNPVLASLEVFLMCLLFAVPLTVQASRQAIT